MKRGRLTKSTDRYGFQLVPRTIGLRRVRIKNISSLIWSALYDADAGTKSDTYLGHRKYQSACSMTRLHWLLTAQGKIWRRRLLPNLSRKSERGEGECVSQRCIVAGDMKNSHHIDSLAWVSSLLSSWKGTDVPQRYSYSQERASPSTNRKRGCHYICVYKKNVHYLL